MKKVLNVFGDIVSKKLYKEDVVPSDVSAELAGLTADDELEININCYGGEVFAAVAIASMIEKSPATKTFNVVGICASAATMLFNAVDKVNIFNGAMLMYHKPIIGMQGNANDFRDIIERLDKIESQNIIANLITRTKKPIDELSTLISNEWWLTSDEAVENLGFTLSGTAAIENRGTTKQENIYKNYIEKKKALSKGNAFNQFINFKNSLK
jgi:ATP-dependent protease ClpP protease subunit